MNNKMSVLALAGILMINSTSLMAQEVNIADQNNWVPNGTETQTTKEKQTAQEKQLIPTLTTETVPLPTPIEGNPNQEGIQGEQKNQEQPSGDINSGQSSVSGDNKVVLTLDSKEANVYGLPQTLPVAPTSIQGRTYLPLRFVGETILGASVQWDPATKQIKVVKDTMEIILQPGLNKAIVNGAELPLDAPPIVDKGNTLLPVRFMSEQFGLGIQYFPETKQIQIEKPVVEVQNNTAPIASFSFDKESYIAGQSVQVVETSQDPDGDVITDRLWMINNDQTKTANNLEKIFKKPKAGTYDISLKVRDQKGAWSEWTTVTIVIEPNRPPEITELRTLKDSYAQGEKMEIAFSYDNEEWETIKTQKWTYRAINDAANNILFTKPTAIYAPGDYIVSLELQDEYGNWGPKKEATIHITDQVIETEFQNIFNSGEIGKTVTNFKGFNYQNFKEALVQNIQDVPGKLIMSDSPEVVGQKGVLYEETLTGTGRMLFHHINNFDDTDNQLNKRKLVVIAKNNGSAPVLGSIDKLTVKGPSSDVLFVGQQLLYSYFDATGSQVLSLAPNEQKVIYDSKDKKWLKGQAISGMFDFAMEGNVTFTVAVIDEADKLETVATMNRPVRDVHPRGTFYTVNKLYAVDLTNETESTKLVLGKGADEWLVGKDGLTGEIVTNRGNFGMEYRISITANEDTAIILNPRGNMFKGAIKWLDDKAYLTPNTGYFPSSNRATFTGVVKAGQTRELVYMLPNGSSAPVLIGFIPKSQWDK